MYPVPRVNMPGIFPGKAWCDEGVTEEFQPALNSDPHGKWWVTYGTGRPVRQVAVNPHAIAVLRSAQDCEDDHSNCIVRYGDEGADASYMSGTDRGSGKYLGGPDSQFGSTVGFDAAPPERLVAGATGFAALRSDGSVKTWPEKTTYSNEVDVGTFVGGRSAQTRPLPASTVVRTLVASLLKCAPLLLQVRRPALARCRVDLA